MNQRISFLCSRLEQRGLDALLLVSSANISYITGFPSRDAYLLISAGGKGVYFTDSRYSEEAQESLKNPIGFRECNGTVFSGIGTSLREMGIARLGFEERHLSFAEFARLKELSGKAVELIPVHGMVEASREVKDKDEVEKIKKAVKITGLAYRHIKKLAVPGASEMEIAGEFEHFVRLHGCNGPAFDTIVASGPNSSRPHHLSGQRKLRRGEGVLMDLGVDYLGYKSDLTRVVFLGKINPLVREIYDIVRKAHDLAIERIHPGAEMSEIDRVAREYIASKGYAACFTHNLGHGVGLEIHEEPHFSRNEASAVKPGMVFTVEPGIYLPGKFGVRIEDLILVTRKGCEVLSGAIN
ncbi:MAG: Xaa-Pro peptidase family protein [Candidatus Omnitrophica bacterium]|nr:Xaa-Pro peptidase family protein [Candidatus Omnitrophota bacterium]MDD5500351.1 Xaa-Pro peptidase family protein [Candidatus Omnitrophota bacterium]